MEIAPEEPCAATRRDALAAPGHQPGDTQREQCADENAREPDDGVYGTLAMTIAATSRQG
jgi:hypothetical protein